MKKFHQVPFFLKLLTSKTFNMAEITYREALNQALSEEISRDPNVVLMGEEVAQFKGSYKVSEGLLEKFGSEKIIDTPISEAAFSGLAVGAAMMGMRPVVEFMFWSFCYVAFDQIFNNAASVRYMSGGLINVPIVFRGPQTVELMLVRLILTHRKILQRTHLA